MYLPKLTDLAQFVRGFLMGGADIIPGVSGGTVALILGIYSRLVTAISHCDAQLLRLIAERRWWDAARHVDLRFLVTLGMGILTGVVSLAGLMHYLLTAQRPYTLAAFMGLILASSFVVARSVQPKTTAEITKSILLGLLAAVFAFCLVGAQQFGQIDHLGYYFLCGTVAICAMILPGISGAYILLLLGAYETVTDILHRLPKLDVTSRDIQIVVIFSCGCAIGIVAFSKLLRWLLANVRMSTMAVLCGFMIGSLRLMWPFQIDKTPDVEKLKLKEFEAYMPTAWTSEVTTCLVVGLAALAAVLLLEKLGSGTQIATPDPTDARAPAGGEG